MLFKLIPALLLPLLVKTQADDEDLAISGEVLDAICQHSTIENWNLPIPGICNKWVKCSHDEVGKYTGLWTVYVCDTGLVFNPLTETCDFPRYVDCTYRRK